MTDRRFPTRIIPTSRPANGAAGQGVGWLQPLEDRLQGLRAQLQGVYERLSSPLADGVPSAVTGEVLFKQNEQVKIPVKVVLFEEGGEPAFGTLLCNPILQAGQTYRIPITFSPPGVFMAHNLVVTVEAGWETAPFTDGGAILQQRPLIWPLPDYRQNTNGGFLDSASPLALNFSNQQQYLHYGYDTSAWGQQTYLPYFWNIIDEKSGRQYSQDWLPHGLLMNRRFDALNAVGTNDSSGEFFEFDVPWLFERDAQVSFLFRPIVDLYNQDLQALRDLGAAVVPAQAKVCVEFHGNRYYTRQDVLKEGARL